MANVSGNQFITQTNLPHDERAEEAVISAVFYDDSALPIAMQYLNSRDFYNPLNRKIFKAFCILDQENMKNDKVTVLSLLQNKYHFSHNPVQYISQLSNAAPNDKHIQSYAKIVQDTSISRQVINATHRIVLRSYKKNLDPTKLLDYSEAQILRISQKHRTSGLQPLYKLAHRTYNQIMKTQNNPNNQGITGEPTGFQYVDQLTTGLHPGEFYVIAARPAMGKTTIALNIANNVAASTHKTVAVFSLEMGSGALVSHLMCANGNVDAMHLRSGRLTPREIKRLLMSTHKLLTQKIWLDDTPGINIASIMARSRRLAKRTGDLGLIVIDYLQLIEGMQSPDRQQVVAQISRQLKKMAKALHVPVIALSQLSRSVEQREDKRPVLSDIRESGAIEQDADVIAFLYRKDYYLHRKEEEKTRKQDDKDKKAAPVTTVHSIPDGDPSLTEFIIEKNREGPRSTVMLCFYKAWNKFVSISQQDAKKMASNMKHE